MNEVSDEEKIKIKAKEYCSLFSECYTYLFDTEIEEESINDVCVFLKTYREFVDNDGYIKYLEIMIETISKNPEIEKMKLELLEIRHIFDKLIKINALLYNPIKVKLFIYGNITEWENNGNIFLFILQNFLANAFIGMNYDDDDDENCYTEISIKN